MRRCRFGIGLKTGFFPQCSRRLATMPPTPSSVAPRVTTVADEIKNTRAMHDAARAPYHNADGAAAARYRDEQVKSGARLLGRNVHPAFGYGTYDADPCVYTSPSAK